jgi:ADP-heptose:LPS heptosyltransferase
VLGVADRVISFDRYDLFGPACKDDPIAGAVVISFLGDQSANGEDPFLTKGAGSVIWKPSRPSGDNLHAVEYLRQCIREALPDIAPLSKKPFVVKARKKSPVKTPYAVFAPGAGGPGKRAPLEKFVSVARELARKGMTPLFVAGEVEIENDLVEQFPPDAKKLVSPGLPYLAQVLVGAERVYTNDSGVGHLAALVGADTRVFFGPTNPDVWKPWGERVTILRF